MGNNIPLFDADVVTSICRNTDANLADISVFFYEDGLTLIPAWISNYIRDKMWDNFFYSFLN